MTTAFADSYFYFALLISSDPAHELAVDFTSRFRGRFVTTEWVLTEVADGLADPGNRPLFNGLLQGLQRQPQVTIVPASEHLFHKGTKLYAERADKAWSLTDCISFSVMRELKLTDALTADRHFEQAGFKALLM